MKKIILLSFIFASVLFAQVESSSSSNTFNREGNFFLDYAGYMSAVPNKTRIDVFVQVPYSNISFVKKDDGFRGGFDITLTFMDEKKNNIIFERNWKEKVSSEDFTNTLSKSNFYLSYKSFDLSPGKYFLKCVVEDSDSRRISSKELPLNVRQITDSLGVSDIMLISEIVKEAGGERIVPNISSTVTSKNTSLSFFFDLYSSKQQDVVLEYTFNDIKENTSLKQEDPRTLKPGVNTITHTIKNTNFTVGDFELTVTLKDINRKTITSVDKKLHAKIGGLPSTIIDLDIAINQMLYIASPEELDYIKDGKAYDEKMARFLTFWDKKKPNPKEDDNPILYEYYRRIDYANKHFKGLGDGWRSDMGMVFVTFGPPSSVERHPMDMDSKPYEIWQYYELNRSFVFLDHTGFGDYRLLDPDYSRWPGYRQ
ncbi:MAG: GWxTD domain-containing protein [Ignavibacteriales bacterium]|nr:GWxTD domain-containing protein [Ignavibacteriales bacterium]